MLDIKAGFTKKFDAFREVARTDYKELEGDIGGIERECITQLGYIKLAARYDIETEELVEKFLKDAAKRIINVQRIFRCVMSEYKSLLKWFGMVPERDKMSANRLAEILVQFAKDVKDTIQKVEIEERKAANQTAASSRKSSKHVTSRASTFPIGKPSGLENTRR